MTRQPVLLSALTLINVAVLLATLVLQARPALSDSVPDVLRAHGLQIVDAQGRVRASISVLPEDPKVIWNGKPYPETVLLRLITAEGRPNVKLAATSDGSALMIACERDPTHVQILAREGEAKVSVSNQDGAERTVP